MEQKVSFYSDGRKLAGVLFEPDGAADNSCPGVVLCQGMSGLKEVYRFPEIARRFVALGCVALIFDYNSIGESEGEPGRFYPLEQVEDIRNALTFLEIHSKVDGRRLALYGMSFGGGTVPYAAAVDPRVQCAISVVGFGDGERLIRSFRPQWEWLEFKEWVARDRQAQVKTGRSEMVSGRDILLPDPNSYGEEEEVRKGIPNMENFQLSNFSLASMERVLEFKPVEVVDRISPRAIMFISAEKDTTTPADDVHAMYQRAREPKKLWCIPGIKHYDVYRDVYFEPIMEMTANWLRQHLHIE